jgi:pyrroloquinoline quinone (PQQ) biosynthesis protein C
MTPTFPLSTAEFFGLLDREIEQKHAHFAHPLIGIITAGEASREVLQEYCRQNWAIPKYNIAVNAGKLSQVQPAPGDFLGDRGGYDEHIVKHFANIIVDELGSEILPFARERGHYELYIRWAAALGIPRQDMEGLDIFFSQTLIVLNDWVRMARELPLVESCIGMNYCNERASSHRGLLLYRVLQEKYGMKAEDVEFFRAHGEQDAEHSSIGPYVFEKYALGDAHLQHRIWIAAQRGLGMFWTIYDAVWNKCYGPRRLTPAGA